MMQFGFRRQPKIMVARTPPICRNCPKQLQIAQMGKVLDLGTVSGPWTWLTSFLPLRRGAGNDSRTAREGDRHPHAPDGEARAEHRARPPAAGFRLTGGSAAPRWCRLGAGCRPGRPLCWSAGAPLLGCWRFGCQVGRPTRESVVWTAVRTKKIHRLKTICEEAGKHRGRVAKPQGGGT